MSIRTVKVSNVSLSATEQDIQEFFSFSGAIEYVEMRSDNERCQAAFVTFKDSQGAETAVLLSGATIVDQSVTIALEPDYVMPPAASASFAASDKNNAGFGASSAVQKAEDVVSSMLAKGFILGKDAVNKAKAFDEKHQVISTATAKVASLDQKIGLSEKITIGATIMNDKVKEVDEKFQVSEKTKSAFAVAEQTVNTAGSAIMKNRYILTGASWVTGAFSRVSKAAEEVGQKTMEKVAEEEHGRNVSEGYSQLDSADSPKAATSAPTSAATSAPTSDNRPPSPKGLIL
ncbi:Binding partner of ACD11 1 [Sesamum alatum]|uniref:Binding partner of ACD11 1 n=1 Tax=Sesamum alatum TaxID=300844 RepID=A0AAE1YMX8_9LAMI|nr:Binding partner of ACD11 1 [Sesamum alatum]